MTAAIDLCLRDARRDDCAALTELCLRSKAHWGYDVAFMAAAREALTVTPARLCDEWVRVAETDGALAGVAAVSFAAGEAELELMFVAPEHMRRGVGRALMADVCAKLFAAHVHTLWILSDPGAEPFYRALGAVREGQRPSDVIPGRELPWLRLALAETR